jgi:putative transcriptional regulator
MKPTRDKQPAAKARDRDQSRRSEAIGGNGAEGEAATAPKVKKTASRKAVARKRPLQEDSRSFLDGQLLIAMPGMADERFARSVIYMCAHSAEGAMGIMLNRPSSVRNFPELLEQLRVIDSAERISLSPGARDVQVLSGGPVQTDRGFVLHTGDFFIDNSTLKINDAVSLTATIDILRAIATGQGPDQAILALGCAGWDAGQLENEIQLNGWLHCPADPAILFDHDLDTKYVRALRSIGVVDLCKLSPNAGHA